MAKSEIKGEFVLMMDGLVRDYHRDSCREASRLDFDDIKGKWVPQDAFNAYVEKLRQHTGEFGPYIVGTRIVKTINQLMPLKEDVPTLKDFATNLDKIYLANNRGADVGEYNVVEFDEEQGVAVAHVTSPLDEGFHMGVLEGAIRFYANKLVRSEAVEKIAETGKSVFRYTWRP